jgi:hypothetical protein
VEGDNPIRWGWLLVFLARVSFRNTPLNSFCLGGSGDTNLSVSLRGPLGMPWGFPPQISPLITRGDKWGILAPLIPFKEPRSEGLDKIVQNEKPKTQTTIVPSPEVVVSDKQYDRG